MYGGEGKRNSSFEREGVQRENLEGGFGKANQTKEGGDDGSVVNQEKLRDKGKKKTGGIPAKRRLRGGSKRMKDRGEGGVSGLAHNTKLASKRNKESGFSSCDLERH